MSFSALARSLAESVLRLRGQEMQAFVEQFIAQASTPSARRIPGDNQMFNQALCFPVVGLPRTKATPEDIFAPYPGLVPHMIIELTSGHLLGCRFCAAKTPAKLSVNAFLETISRQLEALRKRGKSAWSGIQHMIEGQQRLRVTFFDYVLDRDPAVFWEDYFPQGATRMARQALCGIPSTDPGRKKIIASLRSIHSNHYEEACTDFLDRLDGERIQAMRLAHLVPHLSQYNTYLNDQANSRYRIQAAESLPLLSYLLGEDSGRAERLRNLVDAGQPLWPALADTVRVPEETIRWLHNKTAEEVGEAWLGQVHKILPDLAKLPPSKRPQTREDWTIYTDFVLVFQDRWDRRAREFQEGWLHDLARLGWVTAHKKFQELEAFPSDLLDIPDLVNNLIEALHYELTPETQREVYFRSPENNQRYEKISAAVTTLFFETSLLKQLRSSLRWHQLLLHPPELEISEEVTTDVRLRQWPAPLTGSIPVGSLWARFLVTPSELRDEGHRMQHCVGTYDDACLFGGSNIVSFRDQHGRSVSTAELRMETRSKDLRLAVVQHRGHRDQIPSSEAETALEYLLDQLRDPALQPRLQEMQEQLTQRQAMDKAGERWKYFAANAPERLHILRIALKLHVGYERFYAAASKAFEA